MTIEQDFKYNQEMVREIIETPRRERFSIEINEQILNNEQVAERMFPNMSSEHDSDDEEFHNAN